MADDTQNIAIVLTATDSGATSVIEDVRLKIAQIETELNSVALSGGNFGKSLADGGAAGAAGVAAVSKAAADAKTPLEDVAGRTATMAKGFEAAGIGAAGAASRIEGLAGAFEMFKAAAPEILAITAAITALFAAFNFAKDAVSQAAEMQQSMMRMKGIVDETGASWEAVAPQAQKFVDALSAVGVTAGEGAAALNQLMEAGASYHDAQSELAVGAQMVAAGMGDWETVTNALTKAQGVAGDMMLGKLVPGVRAMIQSGASLSQIMEYIRQKTSDAIASDDSLSGANSRLHAEWVALEEIIGQEFLPALTFLIKGLIGVVVGFEDVAQATWLWSRGTLEAFESVGKTGTSFFDVIGTEIRNFVNDLKGSVSDLGDAYKQLQSGHVAGAIDDIIKAKNEFGNLHGATVQVTQSTRDFRAAWAKLGEGMGDIFHPQVAGAEKLDAAMKELAKDAQGVGNLDNNPWSKFPQKGGSGSGFTPGASVDEVQQTQRETAALADQQAVLNRLNAAKQASAAVEDALTNAQKLATTSAQAHAEQLGIDAQKIIDVKSQLAILVPALANEVSMRKQDQAALAQSTTTYNEAKATLDAYSRSLAGQKDLSEAAKEKLAELTAAQSNAKSGMEDAKRAVDTLNTSIREHQANIADLNKQYLDLEVAPTAAIDALSRKWGDFTAKETQDYNEDLATFAMTQSEKYQYYADMVSKLDTLTDEDEARREQAYQKEVQAYEAMIQDEVNARKQALQTEEQETETALDDILTGTKSFAEEMKSIFDDILKHYIDSVVKGFFEPVGAIPGAPVAPGASAAPGQAQASAAVTQAATALQSAASQTSSAATQTGQSATQTGQAATQTSQAATQLTNAATQLQQAATAIRSSASPGGGDSEFNAMISNNPSAIWQWAGNLSAGTATSPIYVAGAPGSVASSVPINATDFPMPTPPVYSPTGGWNNASSNNYGIPIPPGVGQYVGGALGGFGIGEGVAGMDGGNSTWGGIGGALGGILGVALHANPLIGMGIDVVTSLLGSLFGNHWTSQEEPDIAEPVVGGVDYGQFVSNFTGAPGTFNGQTINPQSQYVGNPEARSLFQDLQNMPAGASSAMLQLVSQLKGLEGGGGPTGGLGIQSESQGMFTLDSGKTISVTDYMQLISSFMGDYGAAGGTGGIGSFTLSRTYPNFNLAHRTDSAGNPVTGSSTPPPQSGSTPPTYPPPAGSVSGHTFDFRGASFMGTGGIDTIITQIEQALMRSQAGQIPGSVTNSYTPGQRRWPS